MQIYHRKQFALIVSWDGSRVASQSGEAPLCQNESKKTFQFSLTSCFKHTRVISAC